MLITFFIFYNIVFLYILRTELDIWSLIEFFLITKIMSFLEF